MTAGQRPDADGAHNNAPASAHIDRPRARCAAIRAHIGILTLAIIAIGLLLYSVLGTSGNDSSREHAPTAPGVSAPASAPVPSGPGSDSGEGTPPAQQQQVEAVARGFAGDFAAPGTGQQDWWTRVTRWTIPYLSEQFARTDWNRIPQAQVTELHTTAAGPTVVDVEATYDTGLAIGIRVERTPQGWRVTTVVPMRTAY